MNKRYILFFCLFAGFAIHAYSQKISCNQLIGKWQAYDSLYHVYYYLKFTDNSTVFSSLDESNYKIDTTFKISHIYFDSRTSNFSSEWLIKIVNADTLKMQLIKGDDQREWDTTERITNTTIYTRTKK